MTRVHHFACTACGRCCQRPPALSLCESWLYGDAFVCVATLHVAPLDSAIGRRFATLGGLVSDARVATLTATALARPSARRCPKLADGGACDIHARRPNACRLTPLDTLAGEHQDLVIETFKKTGETLAYACDWQASAPRLVDDGNPVDTYAVLMKDGVALERWDNTLLGVLADAAAPSAKRYGLDVRHRIASLPSGAGRHHYTATTFLELAHLAVQRGWIDKPPLPMPGVMQYANAEAETLRQLAKTLGPVAGDDDRAVVEIAKTIAAATISARP